MTPRTHPADEAVHQETQRVAGEIERGVAGVMVNDTSRERFTLSFEGRLPPEVGEIARENGYVLDVIYGNCGPTVKFKRSD